MEPFGPRLLSGPTLVGDGAMGTLLMARGLGPGRPPDEAVLTRPEWVVEAARGYADAGAQVVETDTFGASPLKLAFAGLAADAERINREAVALAREGAAGRAWVAGSCGPCGRLLQPYGDAEPAAVRAGFVLQAGALAAAGADAILVETMTDLAEAKLAVSAAREAAPGLPVIALMTFEATPRGFRTVMGTSVAAAAAELEEAGADAVGSNCGNGARDMVEIAREFRRCSTLPLVVQPNAGLPRVVGGALVYGEGPEDMAREAEALPELGVALVGGCCGTTPEHVRALRAMVDRARERAR